MRKISITILLAIAFVGPSWAEVSVAPYLEKIPGYTARQQEEIVKLGDRKQLGSYPATVLNEFILKSYSRWEVVPTGEGVPVEVEVYELADPPGAFGLYSLWDRTAHPQLSGRLNLPIEHRYAGQDLIFWRNSYFLHLRQADAGNQKEKVEQLVRSLLDVIPAVNALPVAIAHLPVDELRGESVEFYLGQNGLALNPDFPKPLVPVVGLQDHIEIGFGRYKPDNTPLFLIAYPTPAVAQKYSVKIQDALSEYFGPGIYLKKSGPLIGMVVGSETDATRLLGRLNYKAKVKWIEEKPKDESAETRTFLGTVTRAIIGTLVFLLVTGGLGIVVGYFRYLFIRSHPEWRKKNEMIRLKLDER
ncbi:MAG: hypothetical protein EHM61_10530 [Acidobacteria bacterium]|nr:MAG: hypothetical protein EHM61_10530 [Acidobacteriota bacterium]